MMRNASGVIIDAVNNRCLIVDGDPIASAELLDAAFGAVYPFKAALRVLDILSVRVFLQELIG